MCMLIKYTAFSVFVFVFFACERRAEGERAVELTPSLAKGNQCRHSSGNHSVASVEDSENWSLTRGRAC